MRVEGVDRVVARVVEAEHNVTLNAVCVVDEEVGDGRAVGDEVCANPLRRDLVLAIGIRANCAVLRGRGLRRVVLGEGRGREERQHSRGPHGAGYTHTHSLSIVSIDLGKTRYAQWTRVQEAEAVMSRPEARRSFIEQADRVPVARYLFPLCLAIRRRR